MTEEPLAEAHVYHSWRLRYVDECAHSKSDLAEFTKQAMGQVYSQ